MLEKQKQPTSMLFFKMKKPESQKESRKHKLRLVEGTDKFVAQYLFQHSK